MSDIDAGRARAAAASAAERSGPAPRLRGRAALAVFLLACIAFAGLAADLLAHGPLTALDPAIGLWFHAHARPPFTIAMRAVTGLHATAVVLAYAAVAATVLALRGERAWALMLAACVPGGMALNVAVKNAFQRPRPSFDHPLVTLTTYSFRAATRAPRRWPGASRSCGCSRTAPTAGRAWPEPRWRSR
jgi:hypothetical protein